MSHSYSDHYQIRLSYDGSPFYGWQIQSEVKTVQGELVKTVKDVFGQDAFVLGASRTDSGVHALGQVAKVSMNLSVEPRALLKALNDRLPTSIRVYDCLRVHQDYHPIGSTRWKEYRYYFSNSPVMPPHLANFVSHFPGLTKLNEQSLVVKQALALFTGTHDFKYFYCQGSDHQTTVRTIYFTDIKEISTNFARDTKELPLFHNIESLYCIRIHGNGFLKQMIRMMVGALMELARGKLTLQQLEQQISGKNPLAFKPSQKVAPAQGLYLYSLSDQDYPQKGLSR